MLSLQEEEEALLVERAQLRERAQQLDQQLRQSGAAPAPAAQLRERVQQLDLQLRQSGAIPSPPVRDGRATRGQVYPTYKTTTRISVRRGQQSSPSTQPSARRPQVYTTIPRAACPACQLDSPPVRDAEAPYTYGEGHRAAAAAQDMERRLTRSLAVAVPQSSDHAESPVQPQVASPEVASPQVASPQVV